MPGPCPGLLRRNESCPDPHSAGSHGERQRETTAIKDPTGADDDDWFASERGLLAAAGVDRFGEEDTRRRVTRVTTALATLRADQIDAGLEGLGDVLDGPDHVHHEDAGPMESLDDVFGWDPNGTNEELRLLLDNDVNKQVEVAFGVIVVCLSRRASDLWQKEVHPVRRVLVDKVCLEFFDRCTQSFGTECCATDAANAACIRDSGSQLGSCSSGHARKHDRVPYAQ